MGLHHPCCGATQINTTPIQVGIALPAAVVLTTVISITAQPSGGQLTPICTFFAGTSPIRTVPLRI